MSATAAPTAGGEQFKGRITFVDNAVDTTTGSIRVKADFANPQAKLWPGMYVNVDVAPRVIPNATVVPAQAVQTGPDSRFVYVVGEDRKVSSKTVSLAYVEEGLAVVDGLPAGARVIVEGAQNVRPGATIAEAARGSREAEQDEARKAGKGKKGAT